MNRTVRILCAALFLGTTGCSLVLSASSTLAKAAAVHVPGAALWSAVGVLELVSLAGTLRWLTASTPRGRAHAMFVVAAVAVVTSVAGVAVYGWFGLVAPVAIVATIHMIHETLVDTEPPAASEPATEIIEAQPTEQVDAERIEPAVAETEVLAKVEPEPEPATTPTEIDDLDPGMVAFAAKLLGEQPTLGRPTLKTLLREAGFEVTDYKTKRLLAALRPVKVVDGDVA